MISEIKERMRGGEGQVVITPIFQPGEFRGGARLIARLTLEKGCSIGYHPHEQEEEIFYILSGRGVVADNAANNEKVVNPGDAAITLGGESHSIRNDGPDTLEILAMILTYSA